MFTLDEIKYGGKYHAFFWGDLNPNATIPNGLANCTTFTYGDCLRDGWQPVSRIVNANNWHKYANGEVIPYDRSLVKKGDVIEWVNGCHVAKVDDIIDGEIYLNCSWYTGEHGVAIYNGSYDTRHFSSEKEMSDFFIENYPTRYYHYWTIEQESRGVGAEPTYIIRRLPMLEPDGEDKSIDQIDVLTDEQNVRTAPNGDIVMTAKGGFYNVYGRFNDGKYIWYQVKENYWIAGVDGRVEYIESEDDIKKLKKTIELLTKRNNELMNAIEQARKDLEV